MPPSFQACCAHDHDCDAEDCGGSWSLNKYIDIQRVRCLNECVPGSCQKVFRSWQERLNPSGPFLLSDSGDPELLIHVPFTGSVKLQALTLIGGMVQSAPDKLKVFINRDDLDFSMVSDLVPVQEWDLVDNSDGTMEYPTQTSKFNAVHSIDLYIPSNFGATEETEVRFIAFKGEYSERRRQAVEAVYEARPVPKDHKIPGEEQGAGWNLGM